MRQFEILFVALVLLIYPVRVLVNRLDCNSFRACGWLRVAGTEDVCRNFCAVSKQDHAIFNKLNSVEYLGMPGVGLRMSLRGGVTKLKTKKSPVRGLDNNDNTRPTRKVEDRKKKRSEQREQIAEKEKKALLDRIHGIDQKEHARQRFNRQERPLNENTAFKRRSDPHERRSTAKNNAKSIQREDAISRPAVSDKSSPSEKGKKGERPLKGDSSNPGKHNRRPHEATAAAPAESDRGARAQRQKLDPVASAPAPSASAVTGGVGERLLRLPPEVKFITRP
jgi:hypothetical protein